MLERDRITFEGMRLKADFFLTPAIEHVVAELAPEEPQSLPEGTARVRRIHVRPEQRHN